MDIIKKDKILLVIDKYKDLLPFAEIIPISALKGINIKELENSIFSYLPKAEKIYSDNEISDQSQQFLFAEIIREKMLARVRQELPFVTAVLIDEIQEVEEWAKVINSIRVSFNVDIYVTGSK